MEMFPDEMKQYPQWAIASDNKIPMVYNKALNKLETVSVTDVHLLMSFADASSCAAHYKRRIGFVLTANDPYTCIDLDVKNKTNESNPDKWTTPTQMKVMEHIIASFATYSEISQSGLGMHLWVKGNIGKGKRRDGVEVYSQERFIICTGNAYKNVPIVQNEELLNLLVKEIEGQRRDITVELEELPEVDDDATIHERAMAADNAAKYEKLCKGEWQDMGFPSQSEADLALMSMYTFYSPSNAQCRRLFRYSVLGAREKANINDRYLDKTLAICRGRIERDEKTLAQQEQMARDFASQLQQAHTQVQTLTEQPVVIETIPGATIPHERDCSGDEITWPPGITGELAKYIYSSSVRPVKQIAITTALGLMAGICGKAWYIPQSGLNGYFVLIARSGVGKETMNSGASYIISQLRESLPAVEMFISFEKFVSGVALRKSFTEKQSFVNINGEFGKIIKGMAADRIGGPMQSFRTDLTDIYQKSGPASIVSGLSYSDKTNNTKSTTGVAFSLMGESTPEVFFEALTREMMEDGFLSRFHIVRYDGGRPPYNKRPQLEMPKELRDVTHQLCTQALTMLSQYRNCEVQFSEEAELMCDEFNLECDDAINASKDEAVRQPWNRAHLKILRLSALIAVGENWINPVVLKHHVEWALTFVRHGMNVMMEEWEKGGIGADDETRMKRVRQSVLNYFKGCSVAKRADLRLAGVITKSDIHSRCASKAAFKNHKMGAGIALDNAIRGLVDLGALIPIPPVKVAELKFTGQGWLVNESIKDLFDDIE